jgi:hypothetical protein
MWQKIDVDLTFEEEKASWNWPGRRGLWPPDLDMLSMFILFQ